MRSAKLVALALLLGATTWSESSAIELGQDGWSTWRLESLGRISDACCYPMAQACNLDARHMSFIVDSDCLSAEGYLQFYVLMEGGRPQRIRALSSTCPAVADVEIRDLGDMAVDETIDWLHAHVMAARNDDVGEQAIYALSRIPGADSTRKLVEIVESRELDKEMREHALFWLAISDSDEAFEYLDQLLTRIPGATRAPRAPG